MFNAVLNARNLFVSFFSKLHALISNMPQIIIFACNKFLIKSNNFWGTCDPNFRPDREISFLLINKEKERIKPSKLYVQL